MMDTLLQEAIDRPFQTGLVTISLGIVGYISLRALYRNRTVDAEGLSKRKYPLPPGPPRDFLIGSVRHFPRSHIWERFCEWQKQYGDIIHISLPGTSLVVLGSYESSQELLSKRPNATAGRAVTYMITNMMDLAWSFAFMQPGVHHSNQRKMMRKAIGPSRVGSHDPQIEQGCSNLMLKYSEFQGYVPAVTFDYLSQLIIRLTYGEQIGNTMGEELSKKNKEIIHLIVDAFFQVWVVDIFHFLRFIPSWFPGATFKRVGARGTALSNYVRYKPFEAVQKLYNSGNLGHSIVKDLLDEFGPDDDARDALAVLDTAGSDTTTAAICAFLHTMYLFPEIASKVFEETRQVTHGQRMLQIADRRHLPFTEAVWKESLRWNPFIPMGVPHVNNQDEVLNGYRIPKGSLIGQNFGYMLTDPKIWGDPDTFRPERFLPKDGEADPSSLPNPLDVIFGYGIRVCPGMYLANRTGFHIAVTTVSLFDIVPLEGLVRPDPTTVTYTDLNFRLPINFHSRFVPRDEKAENLLKSMALSE